MNKVICKICRKETGKKHKYDSFSYLCNNCYAKKYYKIKYKEVIGNKALIRNGKLSKNSKVGKGFISEQIVAVYLGIENNNIKNDNFHSLVDMIDNNSKKVEVKSSELHIIGYDKSGIYSVSGWHFNLNYKMFADIHIFLGFDMYRKNILKVWVINEEIKINTGINIRYEYKLNNKYNNDKPINKYSKYELPKSEVDRFNKILHSLGKDCKYLCDINKK